MLPDPRSLQVGEKLKTTLSSLGGWGRLNLSGGSVTTVGQQPPLAMGVYVTQGNEVTIGEINTAALACGYQ